MSKGVKSKAAIRIGSGLGEYPRPDLDVDSEELALGEYDLIPMLSESLNEDIQNSGYQNITDGSSISEKDIIGIAVEGSLDIDGYYEGLNQILESAFGAVSKTELATDEYEHVFTLADNISQSDGEIRRFTLGIDKETSLWVFRACLVRRLRVNYSISGGLSLTADLVCYDVTRSSTTNTSSDNWKYHPTYKNQMIKSYDNVDFSIDGTPVTIDNLSVDIDHNLNIPPKTIQSGKYIPEPVRTDYKNVSGGVSFPRYTDDNYLDDIYSVGTSNLVLEITGSDMGTNNKSFKIELPYTNFIRPSASVRGSSIISKNIDFECYAGSDIESEVKVTLVNRYPFNDLENER